jgi:hypothetical protein
MSLSEKEGGSQITTGLLVLGLAAKVLTLAGFFLNWFICSRLSGGCRFRHGLFTPDRLPGG